MKYSMLGSLEVATSAGVVTIRARRLRALLAIMLLHPNQVVSIDRIIDGIWPQRPPQSVVENIRTYISQLRSLLRATGDDLRIESHPGGYRLQVGPEELDLLRFTTLAADGRRARHAGDCAGAAVLFAKALELWRGTPLPELDLGPPIRAKIIAVEEQRCRVQADWISARMALGQHADLVPTLRELIADRPLDETLWCYLVTALYSSGRTGDALAAIADARRTFVTELGIEPGPELRRIQTAVLGGEELPNTSPPGGFLVQASLPPHQLPPGQTRFVGRGDVLRRFYNLAARPVGRNVDHPLVAMVSGPPGIGKSATAIAAAAKIRNAFPNGQLYVDLRGSTPWPLDTMDAFVSLLSGLGVSRDAVPGGVDPCRSLYRSLLAERRMLLVLDDVADAEQVAPLIPGPGDSLVFITSRRRLPEIYTDIHLTLEPLSQADALAVLRTIIGVERVDEEPDASVAIVEACGRYPGAIRIAGARLAARPHHPIRVLADRLDTDENILDELSVTVQSLRGQLDVVYRTMEPRLQECFRLLSKLNRDAVTAVGLGELLGCPAHDADRELERLVYEGLLTPGATRGRVPTYWMPKLLHLYARERLITDGGAVTFPAGGSLLTSTRRPRGPGATQVEGTVESNEG